MYETETDHTENRLVTAKGEGDVMFVWSTLADLHCPPDGADVGALLLWGVLASAL